jgi:hypothetical protein
MTPNIWYTKPFVFFSVLPVPRELGESGSRRIEAARVAPPGDQRNTWNRDTAVVRDATNGGCCETGMLAASATDGRKYLESRTPQLLREEFSNDLWRDRMPIS